jgi:hypothetical protein
MTAMEAAGCLTQNQEHTSISDPRLLLMETSKLSDIQAAGAARINMAFLDMRLPHIQLDLLAKHASPMACFKIYTLHLMGSK